MARETPQNRDLGRFLHYLVAYDAIPIVVRVSLIREIISYGTNPFVIYHRQGSTTSAVHSFFDTAITHADGTMFPFVPRDPRNNSLCILRALLNNTQNNYQPTVVSLNSSGVTPMHLAVDVPDEESRVTQLAALTLLLDRGCVVTTGYVSMNDPLTNTLVWRPLPRPIDTAALVTQRAAFVRPFLMARQRRPLLFDINAHTNAYNRMLSISLYEALVHSQSPSPEVFSALMSSLDVDITQQLKKVALSPLLTRIQDFYKYMTVYMLSRDLLKMSHADSWAQIKIYVHELLGLNVTPRSAAGLELGAVDDIDSVVAANDLSEWLSQRGAFPTNYIQPVLMGRFLFVAIRDNFNRLATELVRRIPLSPYRVYGSEATEQETGYTSAITWAVICNNIDVLRYLVLDPSKTLNLENVNALDKKGRTALHHAAKHNHHAAIRILLSVTPPADRINVDSVDQKGRTAFYYAVRGNHDQSMELLMYDCDTTIRDAIGQSPFLISARYGWETTMLTLLSLGANIEEADNSGQNALILASLGGPVDGGALPAVPVDFHTRHLREYQAHRFEDVVRMLISRKCNLNRQTNSGRTALMAAAVNGHSEIVSILLENSTDSPMEAAEGIYVIRRKPDVTLQDEDGNTAVHLAVREGRLACVRQLMSPNRRLEKMLFHRNRKNADAFDLCTSSPNGSLEVMYYIVDVALKKLSQPLTLFINTETVDRLTMVANAVRANRLDMVRYLIDNGADAANIGSGANGHTLLHYACSAGLPMVQLLLETYHLTTMVHMLDAAGNTPLHVACSLGALDIAKLLHTHGAQFIYAPSMMEAATTNGHLSLVEWIFANSATHTDSADLVAKRRQDRLNTYVLAARYGRLEIMQFLYVETGAGQMEDTNSSLMSALSAAIQGGRYGRYGAVRIALGRFDRNHALHVALVENAIDLALRLRKFDIVLLLMDHGVLPLEMIMRRGTPAQVVAVAMDYRDQTRLPSGGVDAVRYIPPPEFQAIPAEVANIF